MTKESSKLAKYKRLYAQVEELTAPVDNPLSRMSTMVALLHHKMKGFFWTGFYLLQDGELLVGPYQGPWLVCDSEKMWGFVGRVSIPKKLFWWMMLSVFRGILPVAR